MSETPSKRVAAAFMRQAVREMDDRMRDMMTKLRKGATSTLTFKRLKEVLDFLGDWKVEPIFGLVDMNLKPSAIGFQSLQKGGFFAAAGHGGADLDEAEAMKEWEKVKKSEVSALPSNPKPGEVYWMHVGPMKKGSYGFYFEAAAWKGAHGIRVTDPKGASFDMMPGRYDNEEGWTPKGLVKRPSYLIGWVMKNRTFIEQLNEALGTEEHVPGNPRTQEGTGSCPACFRNIKMAGKTIVLHGYQRPGDGYLRGNCFGTGYQAFELSAEGTIAYRKVHENELKSTEGTLADLKSGKIVSLNANDRRDPKRTVHPGDDEWEIMLERAIGFTKGRIDDLNAAINRFTRLINNWQVRPLPVPGKPAPIWR